MQLDPNPWHVFHNGKLVKSVRDHATAQAIVRSLYKRFPRDAFVLTYKNAKVNPFQSANHLVERKGAKHD